MRFNPYKTNQKKYRKKMEEDSLGRGKAIEQASFHSHFCQHDHNGIADRSVTLIDKAPDEPSLRKKEAFWQYTLDSFAPNGLNEIDVAIELG